MEEEEDEEEDPFLAGKKQASKMARKEQVKRFLNSIQNMQTPEYLRSLAAVQDSHRILQTISNADFIEKK